MSCFVVAIAAVAAVVVVVVVVGNHTCWDRVDNNHSVAASVQTVVVVERVSMENEVHSLH